MLDVTLRQQRVKMLLDHAYNLAKEYDALHKETKSEVENDIGPFVIVDDSYNVINLLDNNKFSAAEIANMDSAIQLQAKHDDLSDAGMALLKLVMSLLISGASIAFKV